MRIFSWIIFFCIIIIEGTMTTLPLTLLFLLCLTVMKRQEWIFPLALVAGVFLDSFALRQIGISSIFFVSFVFLILLYQRKYETSTATFVVIASFFGSFVYLLLIGTQSILIQSCCIALLSFCTFSFYRIVNKPLQKNDGFQRV